SIWSRRCARRAVTWARRLGCAATRGGASPASWPSIASTAPSSPTADSHQQDLARPGPSIASGRHGAITRTGWIVSAPTARSPGSHWQDLHGPAGSDLKSVECGAPFFSDGGRGFPVEWRVRLPAVVLSPFDFLWAYSDHDLPMHSESRRIGTT